MSNKKYHLLVKRADGGWYLENSIGQAGKEKMVYCSAFDTHRDVEFVTYLTEGKPQQASFIRATLAARVHFELWFGEDGLLEQVVSDGTNMGCIRMDVNHDLFKYIEFI